MTVVGIDLGGTKVAAASLRDRELGPAATERTHRSGQARLLDQLAALVERTKCGKLEAVGIGVPSVVEFETGRVISSVNVPLVDVPIRQVLGERLGVPVFVDNDATVAALAEAHDEQLRMVAKNLVMITVGTGIGGGLVLGGRIYRGATGGAGELGHTLVAADLSGRFPAAEGFPQPGSLERVAAGSALDRSAAQVAASHPRSALGRRRASGRSALGADIVRAARGGDPAAIGALETWAEHVGIGVANAINTFDPDEVVLGGGGARAGGATARAGATGGALLRGPGSRSQYEDPPRTARDAGVGGPGVRPAGAPRAGPIGCIPPSRSRWASLARQSDRGWAVTITLVRPGETAWSRSGRHREDELGLTRRAADQACRPRAEAGRTMLPDGAAAPGAGRVRRVRPRFALGAGAVSVLGHERETRVVSGWNATGDD